MANSWLLLIEIEIDFAATFCSVIFYLKHLMVQIMDASITKDLKQR